MLMKRLLIATLMTLGLACPAAALAATVLSDTELGGVTGGGIAPELGGQALSQDQQLPQDLGSGYAPPRELPINQGMDHAPGYFAILQSSVEARRERNLLLGGASQQDAMALDIENALSSDVVSTNNIFDGSSLSLGDVTAEVEINQGNDLNQLHRSQGSLTSSIAGHRYEKTVEHRSSSDKYERYVFLRVDRQRGSEQVRTDSMSANVQVGGRTASFDDLAAGVPKFELIRANPIFKGLGAFNLGVASYDGATLTGIGLSFDGLDRQENDLVLKTSLTLPNLDIGTLTVPALSLLSLPQDVPLGSVGGGTIQHGYVLPGLAPRIEELNLGSGFAMVGTGTVNLGKPDVSISGNASIKVSPYFYWKLDLSKLETPDVHVAGIIKVEGIPLGPLVTSLFGRNTWGDKWSIDLEPEPIHFSLDLKELNGKPYAGNVVGSTLLLGDGTGSGTQATGEEGKEWDETSVTYKTFDDAESSYRESREHSVFIGGQMAAAEAEMIALSDGTLDVNHTSNVQLGDGAQQGMRTVNGVNAVSSVAANALNVSRMPTIRAGSPAGVRSITTQHNRFNQQK